MMQVYIDAINASDRTPQYVFSYSLDYVRADNAASAVKLLKQGYTLQSVCKDGVMTSRLELVADKEKPSRKAAAFFSILANMPTLIPVDNVERISVLIEESYSRPAAQRENIRVAVKAITSSGKERHWDLVGYQAEHICDIASTYYGYGTHGEEELLAELEREVAHQ